MIDREKIEKAIQDIDGLLLDFGNAVGDMRGVRELLYTLIEEDPENEKTNN